MGRASRRREQRLAREAMGPVRTGNPLVARTLEGAGVGALIGCFALLVGAANITLALLSARRIDFDGFLVTILHYVAGFIAAGAVLGLFRPMKRTRVGRYALGLITSAVGLFVMLPGMFGPLARWDGREWFVAAGCSVISGVVIARKLAG